MALLDHKAQTLREARRNLNNQHSLDVDELETFYVERADSPVQRVAISLEDDEPKKFLFTGHRGNGKSTELAKLESNLQDQFFVVRYALKNVLDLHDLTYVDILLSLALQLAEKVEASAEVELSKSTRDILESLWSFGQDIEKQSERGTTKGASAELGLGEVVSHFLRLGVRIKSEYDTREVLRERVRHRLSDLLGGLDILAKDISDKSGKQVLCIVEDLDKIDLEEARAIFYDHSNSIIAPKLPIIYTFPVALSHTDELMQVKNYFSDNYVLPNFKLTSRDGEEDSASKKRLRQLLLNRVEETLFEAEAIDLLISYSGGVPRQLITLAYGACLEAGAAKKDKVTREHAEEAIARERQNYDRLLQDKERIALLKEIKQEKRIGRGKDYQDLLHNLSILEYRNHKVWYDVNPLVDELLD